MVKEELAEDKYGQLRQHSTALWSGKAEALCSRWEVGGDWWEVVRVCGLTPVGERPAGAGALQDPARQNHRHMPS